MIYHNTKEKCWEAVRQDPRNIREIPVKFLTEDLLFEAIELNPYCIRDIPQHLITYWTARRAVRKNIDLLGRLHCSYRSMMEEEGIIKYKNDGEYTLNEEI